MEISDAMVIDDFITHFSQDCSLIPWLQEINLSCLEYPLHCHNFFSVSEHPSAVSQKNMATITLQMRNCAKKKKKMQSTPQPETSTGNLISQNTTQISTWLSSAF